MKRTVLQKGSKKLRTICTPIQDFTKAKDIITDLSDTIKYLKTTYSYPRGIGLAAPQIGSSVRISIAENSEGKRYILINPEIIAKSDKQVPIREGCISFLKYRGMVPRYEYVKVKALDQHGKEYIVEGRGAFAMLLQHELDHLDGILYVDYLKNKEKDLFLVSV